MKTAWFSDMLAATSSSTQHLNPKEQQNASVNVNAFLNTTYTDLQ